MEEISIGEFARRSRLSPKALRLYDELGVLVPSRVDEASGYRYYDIAQLDEARLVVMLRQLQLPLAAIKAMLACDAADAASRMSAIWREPTPRTKCGATRRVPGRRAERKEVRYVRGGHTGDARSQPAVREAQRGWIKGRGHSARSSSPCFGTSAAAARRTCGRVLLYLLG